MRTVRVLVLVAAVSIILGVLFPARLPATDEYARRTGKGCIFCHQESTGGQLKTVGFAYIRNGYRYPIAAAVLQKAQALQTPLQKTIRFIAGYVHILAAVIFFGAIFYIHIFVKPTRLTAGIPKAERALGLSCMLLLTVTGIYLTWVRIDRWEHFFDNTFGLMLFVKILLFALMVAIGLTAITVVHRRMKHAAAPPPAGGEPTAATLSQFDGSEGRPAYFVHANTVYDVTASEKWKGGRHFGKHSAGTDLTAALKGAPHGPEVFEKVKRVGELAAAPPSAPKISGSRKVFLVMAYTNLVLVFLILACISVWRWDFPLRLLPEKRAEAIAGRTCLDCHRVKTPGIYQDWRKSAHAAVDVHCDKCHRASGEAAVLKSHLRHDPRPISAVVSPATCGGCHPRQVEEYARSKHANTYAIMWKVDVWLNEGKNNAVERTTGCYACHGTLVQVVDGKPVPGTWPNVGVGRINPDGSKGSCSSCHTRHRFSVAESRRPEACDQCHLGPDHPQIEIYNESKHGTIYHAEGHEWRWDPENRSWRASEHYRAPTCAACHMSAAGDLAASHDVTERLSWETQAPRTVRPSEFAAFPASSDWKREREKMETVCRQCHSEVWTRDHFHNLDSVIQNYNETYYDPVKTTMDALYAEGLLSKEQFFDEALEWHYYEFWHHEGRRARMGTAMMAPDYAWWHGFYELKHRFVHIQREAEMLRQGERQRPFVDFPGKHRP
jgi:predicted heme/steroid binding protein